MNEPSANHEPAASEPGATPAVPEPDAPSTTAAVDGGGASSEDSPTVSLPADSDGDLVTVGVGLHKSEPAADAPAHDTPADAAPAHDTPVDDTPVADPPPSGGYAPPPPGPATPWPPSGSGSTGPQFGFPGGDGPFAARYGLIRPTAGRHFAGVCAAIGQATKTDPVLWRILLAVLTLFGGIGLVAYLAGWLLLPAEGDTASPLEALLGRGQSGTSPIVVIAAGILGVLTISFAFSDGFQSALLGTAVIVGAALLLTRRGGTGQAGTQPWSTPTPATAGAGVPGQAPTTGYQAAPEAGGYPATTGGYPTTTGGYPGPSRYDAPSPYSAPTPGFAATMATPSTTGAPLTPHGPYAGTSPYAASLGYTYPPPPVDYPGLTPPVTPPPRPPKERSPLGRLTVSVLCLALGVLVAVDLTGVSVPGEVYFATAVTVVALGLLVGAWFGRARWLIPVGIVLAISLGISHASIEVDGNRRANQTWAPVTVDGIAPEYDMDFGDATLDLRAVDFSERDVTVTIKVDVGSLTVLLPANVDVDVSARTDVGDATVFDDRWSGVNNGRHNVKNLGVDGAGGGHLALTASVDVGNLEVRR